MKCDHPGSARVWVDDPAPVQLCGACADYVSWGEANDADPRVAVEREAAKRAAFNRETKYQPGYDRFDYCVDTKSGELCALCEALYLVGFINEGATHEEEQEG